MAGQPVISYYDVINQDLKVARWTGNAWAIQTVDSAGNVGLDTSVADVGGQPAISYLAATSNDLRVARWDGIAWASRYRRCPGSVGQFTSIAAVEGQPAISYHDEGNGSLKYARWQEPALVYTPPANQCGVDSFTYHAYDGVAGSNTAAVTVTILGCPPQAVTDLVGSFSAGYLALD